MSQTPAQLWRALVSTDPTRPFVTSYDATGGRVELSRATFDNWVSKTANMLVDGLGTQPRDRVVLALPAHWQSLVWLVSCWSVGATAVSVRDGGIPESAELVVADADRLTEALDSGAGEVVGTSLHPLGLPLSDCPPMVLDYSVEVRGYGDHFSPYPVDAGSPAYRGERDRTGAELVDAARERARAWELTDQDRVAILADPADPLDVLGDDASALLGPVVSGSPIVLTPGRTDGERSLAARLGMENVTAVLGTAGNGATREELGVRVLDPARP